MGNLIWLASYPKSGNTWTRIFLANYLLNAQKPIPINEVHRVGIGDSIADTYRIAGKGRYDPDDYLTHLRQRERVMRGIVNNGADMNFVKTHNENGKAFGTTLIPRKYTRAAIYIVRHPLDVVISYARHYGMSQSQAARAISRPDNTTRGDQRNVMQYLGVWSAHVEGWAKAKGFDTHVMRYEDMKARPHSSFAAMLEYLGVPLDDERLDRAIRFSSFDELRKQEGESGFIERSEKSEKFFHSGTTGQWEGVLSDEDIAFMTQKHASVMAEYGYL